MAKDNNHSTILAEHKSVWKTRYTLVFINFVAILLGTLLTLFFAQKRGIYTPVLMHIYVLIGINVLQILVCVVQYLLRVSLGTNSKVLTTANYAVGVIWFGVIVSELVVATLEMNILRTDLLAVAVIQFIIALVAYFVWPMMDRRAIDAMIRPSVRDDAAKKKKKSKTFVYMYGVLCAFVVVAQAAVLFAYKLPPVLYDLFADTRAVQYTYDKDLDGYVVKAIYQGTSKKVNIPALYNNKPVVGIASGALSDQNIIEKYKFSEITFGTAGVDKDGNPITESHLFYISEGAIVSDKIEELTIPESVERIDVAAIKSNSLKTINYSAVARLSYSSFDCSQLQLIVMTGKNVGTIASLEGMPSTTALRIDKDIYNDYRRANMDYSHVFSPILPENEYCIDFFTDCDYYLDSIFCTVGERTALDYKDLYRVGSTDIPLSVDTEAYIKNRHEINTDGAKPDSAFRGWYTDPAFTQEFMFSEHGSDAIDKNIKLYAKWIPEYTGTLDWGTYTPESSEMKDGAEVLDEMHWTDEDVAVFPVVTNRLGYKDGVVWSLNGEPVQNSKGISESVSLSAEWKLDAPTVEIDQSDVDGANHVGSMVQFTFDESKTLLLESKHSHVLEDDRKNQYSFEWTKENKHDDQLPLDDRNKYGPTQEIHNYVSGGKYTLTVTFKSPYGEVASKSVDLEVDILKKQIILTEVNLAGAQSVYNGQKQELLYNGRPTESNVKIEYRYSDLNNNVVSQGYAGEAGVTNAGTYNVEVIFTKDDIESLNYEVKSLAAKFVISPKQIEVTGWTGQGLEYNGSAQRTEAILEGVVGGDNAGLQYSGNSYVNAGSYIAKIEGLTNKNYSLNLESTYCQNSWSIAPRTLTVTGWTTTGAGWNGNSALYDGMEHSVEPNVEGIIPGDEDKVDYVYQNNANTDAGTYTAKVLASANANYVMDANSSEYQWSITKRPLTITYSGKSYIYNGAGQTMTATIGKIFSRDLPTGALVADEIFDIAAPEMIFAANVDGESITIRFTATNAGTYEAAIKSILSNTLHKNYELVEVADTMVIAKKQLTFSTIDESTREYSGNEQELFLKVEGVYANDLGSFSTQDFATNAVRIDAESGELRLVYSFKNVGTHGVEIRAFTGNSNYEIAENGASASLTITKKKLTVNWTITANTPGAATNLMSAYSYVYNRVGYTVGYQLDGVCGVENVTLDISGNTATNVGSSYMAVVTLPDEYTNYELVGETFVNYEITPYQLNVSWSFNKTSNGTAFVYDGTEVTATPVYTTLGDDVTLTFGGNTGTAVGEYTITVNEATSNPNYVVASGSGTTWNISKRELVIDSWSIPENMVYNGQYQGPSFRVDNLVDNETVQLTFLVETANGTSSINVAVDKNGAYSFGDVACAVNAGTYKIVGVSVSGNYAVDYTVGQSFNIAKKELSLTNVWTVQNGGSTVTSYVYNGDYFIRKTSIDPTSVVQHLGSSVTPELVYENESCKNAGTYTTRVVGLTGANSENYVLPTSGTSSTWTIDRKTVDLVWTNHNFVYTATEQTQAVRVDASQICAGDSVNINLYQGITYKNAGTYTAKALGLDNPNYAINSNTESYVWTIAQRPVQFSWSASSFIYNGGIQYPTAVFNYGDETVLVSSYLDYANTTVGTYTVKVASISDPNYTLVGGTELEKTYEIEKRTLELIWHANGAMIDSLVYNDAEGSVYATIANLCGDDEVMLVYSNTTYRDAGNYTAEVRDITGAAIDNYKLGSTAIHTYAVAKKPVTFEWYWDNSTTQHNMTFDGKPHTLYVVIKGAEGDDVLTPVYSSGNDVAVGGVTNAGTYTVAVRALNDSTNYSFNSAEASRSIVIDKQTVNVVWDGVQSIVYDGTDHVLKATVTGINNGATVHVNFAYDNNRNAYRNAGIYTVSISLADSNYQVSANDRAKTLTIAKHTVTVVWSDNDQFVYNGSTYTATAQAFDKDNNQNNALINQSGGATLAGTHSATVSLVDSTNYQFAAGTETSHTFTIAKQPVTLVWSGETNVTYDGNAHGFTVEASGISGVDNSLVQTLSTYIDAGTHQVSAVLADKNNYMFAAETTTSQRLVIEPQKVVITWTPETTFTYYSGRTQRVEASVVGANDGKPLSNGSAGFSYTDSASSSVNVGTYTRTISLNNKNYTTVGVSGTSKTYTITPQKIAITWSANRTFIYNGSSHSVSATVVGADDNNSVSFVYGGMGSAVNKGTYTRNIASLNNSNYTLTGVENTSCQFTINPYVVVNIEWDAQTDYTYDGVNRPIKALIYGYNGALLQTITVGHFQDAGTYTFSLEDVVLNNLNHTLEGATNLEYTLTVAPKAISVVWAQLSTDGVYAPNVTHGYEVAFSGVVAGDSVFPVIDGTLTAVNVGDYEASVTGLNGAHKDNYTLSQTLQERTKTYSVAPQEVSIVWAGNNNVVFDGREHIMTATVRGASDGVLLAEFTLRSSVSGGVGEYSLDEDITLTGINAQNYVITSNSGAVNNTLTVTAGIATVRWYLDGELVEENAEIEYDGEEHVLSYEIVCKDNEEFVVQTMTIGAALTESGKSADATATLTGDDFTMDTDAVTTRYFTILPEAVQ